MKKLIITACFMLAIQGIIAQKQSAYSITGSIKGVPDGTVFYLIRTKENGNADTVSKVKSINGIFSIKGALKLTPEFYFLKMDTSVVKLAPKTNSWIRILLDNVTVSLTGDLKNWPNIKLEGSAATTEYDKIYSAIDVSMVEFKNKLMAADKEVPKDKTKLASIVKEMIDKYFFMLKSYPNAYATPCMAITAEKLTSVQTEEIYNALSVSVKNSFYGQKLKKRIQNLILQEKVAVGKVIPEFFIINERGTRQSIIELAKHSKYTLIDFWASWCSPCREAIPNIKKVYNTFKDRGFNVVGVSTDTKIGMWKKALKEENIPWINGMQEGRVSNEVFGMYAIPGYILLNDKAEILVMDIASSLIDRAVGSVNGSQIMIVDKNSRLSGEDLNRKIESLLGKDKGK